ncbi:hypothetical protein AAIH25_06825 [Arthrobacter crystallopoietes]|uniref:hypothetical protein n=1 Tax=Micrococcaceae TaxID=1268 RepID=UPI0021CA56E3|nr:hypothetical protein [Arthrobacter sp. Marseille-P9274]
MKTLKRSPIRKAPLILRLAFRTALTVLIAFFATGFIVTVIGITDPAGENIVLAATVAVSLALFLCLTYRAGIKRKAVLGAAARDFSGGSLLLLGTMKTASGPGGGSSGSGGDGGGWSGGDCGDGGGGGD